jgi:hypothetical protein
VVTVRFTSSDRDACTGRAVRRSFRAVGTRPPDRLMGRRTGEGSEAQGEALSGSTGPNVRPSQGRVSRASRLHLGRVRTCQGYRPCLVPGADVDCAGGSGNGPHYVHGPVYVNGSDPYGLDSDGDGSAVRTSRW